MRTFCAEPEGLRVIGRKVGRRVKTFQSIKFSPAKLDGGTVPDISYVAKMATWLDFRPNLPNAEWKSYHRSETSGWLVPPTRIERATRGLGNRCSIQLSYGGVVVRY